MFLQILERRVHSEKCPDEHNSGFLLPNYIKAYLAFRICPLRTSLGGREVKIGLVSSCPVFGNGWEGRR